jgi:hypothetical protein
MSTNPLPAGRYYINASAVANIDVSDATFCYITSFGSGAGKVYGGSVNNTNLADRVQISVVDSLSISDGGAFGLMCYDNFNSFNTYIASAGLTATLIDSSFAANKKVQHLPAPSVPGEPANTK